MATAIAKDLRGKSDAAWAALTGQLAGMEPYLDRADAPGEWTTREVLSHLLFDEGWSATATLRSFADRNLPTVEIVPGKNSMTPARKTMALKELVEALDRQRAEVFGYLDTLGEAELGRQARIPLFKQLMGTDEVAVPAYVGALFGYHWADHTGQLAKIRKAVGLPEAV